MSVDLLEMQIETIMQKRRIVREGNRRQIKADRERGTNLPSRAVDHCTNAR